MIAFWIVAAGLSAAAAGLVLYSAHRRRLAAAGAEDAAVSMLRRQMAEIDDLVARGLLNGEERESSRAEAGRRLLAAADRPSTPVRTDGDRLVLIAAGTIPILAMALYFFVGQPGARDASMASRIAAWRQSDPATLTAGQISAVLSQVAVERPQDAEVLRNLSIARQAAGDKYGAAKALRQAVALKPSDPALWSALGEAFMVLADGQIGVDARQAFLQATKLDPEAPVPRYFLARARAESGDVAGGLADWKSLLGDLPSDDERRTGLAAEIASLERNGKLVKDEPAPAAASGDMGAAIQNMVAGLARRLEEQPDDPDGWARLIRAYSVLGETGKRDAAMARAQKLFKDRPDVLERLKTASEAPQ